MKAESTIKPKSYSVQKCGGLAEVVLYENIVQMTRENEAGEAEKYFAYDEFRITIPYRENLAAKGAELKIGADLEFAQYIENKIIKEKYSPAAVLGEIKAKGIVFKTTICVSTFYSYIEKGIFLHLTNKNLPVKGKKSNRHYHRVKQKRRSAGESIENRPEDILTREEFGHWEMDTVKGKQGVTKSCMLVLTERKTRDEIIFKLKDQKAESVVDALDRLERKWGDMFSKVFRSITVDNGVEFSDCKGMERSALTPGEKRTYLFYCHPYSSWERGTNENTNKLIRRHIPKGEDFDEKQDRDIEFIENWINTYPRGIFDFKTSEELFSTRDTVPTE